MLFRAGAAIATVMFLHGAGNLERDAGTLMANAGNTLPGSVSTYCQSAPATCLALAKQAGASLITREDAALHTAAKGYAALRSEGVAPVLPMAADSILPPRRKTRG